MSFFVGPGSTGSAHDQNMQECDICMELRYPGTMTRCTRGHVVCHTCLTRCQAQEREGCIICSAHNVTILPPPNLSFRRSAAPSSYERLLNVEAPPSLPGCARRGVVAGAPSGLLTLALCALLFKVCALAVTSGKPPPWARLDNGAVFHWCWQGLLTWMIIATCERVYFGQ